MELTNSLVLLFFSGCQWKENIRIQPKRNVRNIIYSFIQQIFVRTCSNVRSWIKQTRISPLWTFILACKHMLESANFTVVIKEAQIKTKRYKLFTKQPQLLKLCTVVKGQEKWAFSHFGGGRTSWCKISFLGGGYSGIGIKKPLCLSNPTNRGLSYGNDWRYKVLWKIVHQNIS